MAGRLGRPTRRLADRLRRLAAARWPTLLLSLAAAVVVFWLATDLFPYHSANHDEAVYLRQAELLLAGQHSIHAGALADSVRPWFFVQDGGRLYGKYSPVAPAVFALGIAVGVPRLSLALVAAANVALVVLLAEEAYDRRTGLLAGALLLVAPMFLLTSSVFLSYAPATALNLAFALGYVRAHRRGSTRWAALAGVAIGAAFFARPYTAVLFAAPFVAHACWTLWATRSDRARFRAVFSRQGTIAALGTAGVCLALAYNWLVTGDPLVFPYQAFAPLDGPGFGRRRILGHEVQYTPALALRANAVALWSLATRWSALPPVGALAALLGGALAVAKARVAWRAGDWRPTPSDLADHGVRVLLVGVVASVVAGNVPFWGTYNALARLEDPTDGLADLFGPFYHFDLLVPLAVFGAAGLVWTARRLLGALDTRVDGRKARAVALALLALSLPLAGGLQAAALDGPLDRHRAVTDRYDAAYEPFADDPPRNAVVFVPTPYGDWLGHPFQSLRNDPGLDGPRVYALDQGGANLGVAAAYPERRLYRYTYHGDWSPDPDDGVVTALQRLSVVERERLSAETRVAIPDPDARVQVALSVDGETVRYDRPASAVGEELAVGWSVNGSRAWLAGANGSVPVAGEETVVVTVTLTEPGGATLTYRQAVSVAVDEDGVRALWPPTTSVCTLVTDCGREGTYLPDRPDLHPSGIAVETSLVGNETAS
jgi:hypothetical protein